MNNQIYKKNISKSMKQHEILYRFFQTPKDETVKFCINVQSDYKLNVLGIHYIIVRKVGKLPKNYLNLTRHYIGGKDLKTVMALEGIAGPYQPGAEYPVKSLETVVPDSMDYEIHFAVNKVKDEVGSINNYVKSKLGYKTDTELAKALGAEQVDAVAMAVYNIEEKSQAIIIGDQTGIGKGRTAASIIRYACKNGFKPIFVTEKPNLFSDMYRDLSAIGSSGLVPFIVNSNDSKTKVKDENGEVVYEAPAKNTQEKIFNSGKLPLGYDYVMLTYSQVASEKPTIKQSFLSSVSQDNIIILDESHNAGGNIETSFTAKFFYDVVKRSKGVVFLSATFAKRPDNMPLYAVKTAMSEANMSNEQLVDAIQQGGVALQEVLSSNLVAEGQMIRRERSFDGVEVNYITLDSTGARSFGVEDKEKEHWAIADRITNVLRRIIEFQSEHIDGHVQKLDEAVKAEMAEIEKRAGTKELGVDSPPFFSKLFNVVNQMLFAIKAESVADRAIQRLKEGKKPVIAFANTMASFLETMEDEAGNPVSSGSKINTDFTEVLRRGLDGVLRISKKDASGGSQKDTIPLSDLSPEAQEFYFTTMGMIRNISTGISISPIDVIKCKIEEAGYSVAEVTGRSMEVQLKSGSMNGLVMPRKKENVNDAFRRFNDNQVDVLMINQAGSTGASAHAIVTSKVPLEKVKQRVMIMLQAELDINREVQKRGRINRTGQVYKPIYDYIYSAIPAEKRMMMMLQKKLKSLDANTASNQKNSEAVMKSDDFLNKYGDSIVTTWLTENPEINDVLGDPLKLNDSEKTNVEEAAHRVSGRVAVLDINNQLRFYTEVLERYNEEIEYKIQTGEYDLEVESLNFEAETVEKKIAVAGIKGGQSIFSGHSYLEECMVNNLKKPFTKIELDNAIQDALKGRDAQDIKNEIIDKYRAFALTRNNEDVEAINKKHELLKDCIHKEKKYLKLTNEEDKKAYVINRRAEIENGLKDAVTLCKEKANNAFGYLQKFFSFFIVGEGCLFPYGDNDTPAVFLGFKIDEKRPNPYAPSAIKARFALANSLKYLEFVLSGDQGSKVQAVIGSSHNMRTYQKENIIQGWDSLCKESSGTRKKVFIYTGNILQSYQVASGGKLISFTTKTGEVKKGILMPDGWQPKTKGGAQRTVIPLISAIKAIKSVMEGSMVTTDNSVSFMRTRQGFRIFTSSLSVQKFGWLVKNEEILKYITNPGGFQKQSSSWIGDIEVSDLEKVVSIVYDLTKATVSLSDSQMEIVSDEIDTKVETEKRQVFPKLVELEVKLFKMIEEDRNAFGGLGLPASAMTAFEILKKHHPIKYSDPKGKLIADMVSEVAGQTENFRNPKAIGIEKIEIKPLLEKERIATGAWLGANKTLRRSEADVVEWLAAKVNEMLSETDVTPDKNKRLRIAKAKAKALVLSQLQGA